MDILPFINKAFEKNSEPSGFEGWMMVLKANMTIIGDIGFRGIPDDNGDVEIGYGIIEEAQGKGYGFEVAKSMIDWAFSQDKVKSVKADCLINNAPSIRILEKVGMKEIKRDQSSIYWELIKPIKKTELLVFIFDGMADYQITFISHLLNTSADKEIITIAYEEKMIKGRSGFLYKPSRLVADVLNEEAEGLIITGGWYGETKPELIELINNLNSKGKLLSAICGAGTIFLAKAGIFHNVKYTTPAAPWTQNHIDVFGEKDPFPRENFVSERVVRDGNIITALGGAFLDFAIEICDWFNMFESQEDKDNFSKNIKGL
jgi:RimJ/RimL family protein N-acetyltransferase